MYLMLTMRMRAQKMSESTPSTPSVGETPAGRWFMHSFIV
jgi:hypothetical protein